MFVLFILAEQWKNLRKAALQWKQKKSQLVIEKSYELFN